MALVEALTSARLSVAPKSTATTPEFRYLCRLLHRKAPLYTELILDRVLLAHPPLHRRPLLKHNCAAEIAHLGGCSLDLMVKAAQVIEHADFREINIDASSSNANRKDKRFGASLMLEPEFDAIVKSVCSGVNIPVSLMCCTGVDDNDSFDFLCDFISRMVNSGIKHVIIHARKALLYQETMPKNMRFVAPLQYETVYNLKKKFGDSLKVTLNGGIKTAADIRTHLKEVDGVMIGSAIRTNPFLLRELDVSHPDRRPKEEWFEERRRVVQQYTSFTAELEQDTESPRRKVPLVLKPLQNLFYGTELANAWRKALQSGCSFKSPTQGIRKALQIIDNRIVDDSPMPMPEPCSVDEQLRKLEQIFQT